MEKIHIEKFQIDRRYYSQDKNSPLFILESRSGKELTFKVLQRRGPDSMAKAVAKVEPYRSGAQEVARVSCSTGFFDLFISHGLPDSIEYLFVELLVYLFCSYSHVYNY